MYSFDDDRLFRIHVLLNELDQVLLYDLALHFIPFDESFFLIYFLTLVTQSWDYFVALVCAEKQRFFVFLEVEISKQMPD